MASGKIMGIVAWSVAGLLAVGVIVAAVMGQQQASRANGLGEALAQVMGAVGDEEVDPGVLKDAARRTEIVQQVQGAIQSMRTELASAEGMLESARNEAATARTEASAASQRAQEQEGSVAALTKELAVRDEALAAAKTDAEKAVEEARQGLAGLEQELERVKAEQAAEVRRLQRELQAIRSPEPVLGEEAIPGPDPVVPDVIAEVLAEVKEMEEIEEGRFIGASQMFSLIRYKEDRTLFFRLLDGQTLTYQDVPQDVVEKLADSGDRLDVTFRFRIQGEYKSIPPDRVVIRKYWKWLRRHRARGEVRFVEPAKSLDE